MSRAPQLADAALLAIASLALSVLLLQGTFLNPDVYTFHAAVARGQDMSVLHPLYDPIARATVALLRPLGVSVLHALEVLSALSCAVAVLFARWTFGVLAAGRTRANLATGLLAATPSVVFFGTVIENAALLLAFASVAWWLMARYLARPAWSRAGLVGVATAAASFAHATGHLQPIVILAFVVTTRPGCVGLRRGLAHTVLLFAVHAAVTVAGGALLRGDGGPGMGGAVGWLWSFLQHREVFSWVLLDKLWGEWLVPFFPLWLFAVAGFFRRGQRLASLALHGLLLGFLVVAYALIPGMWERGSYTLPLVLFAVGAALRWVPTWQLAAAVPLALGLGCALVVQHDVARAAAVEVADVVALAGDDDPVILVGSMAEIDPVAPVAPDLVMLHVFQVLNVEPRQGALAAAFDVYYEALAARGAPVYLSASGREALAAYGKALLRHIEAGYALRQVTSGAYVVYRVERRG